MIDGVSMPGMTLKLFPRVSISSTERKSLNKGLMKKEYQKPTVQVVQLQHQCQILAGSAQEMRVSGLSDEFYYDSNEGDGSDAW